MVQPLCTKTTTTRARLRAPAGLRVRRVRIDGSDMAFLSFPAPVPLTEAEHAIGAALLDGKSSAQIARERGTALRTIANQIASLYGKLRVRSRSELVAHAVLFGGTLLEMERDEAHGG